MHPILAERRILLLYLAVWVLIGAGFATLVSMRGVLPWQGAAACSIAMSVLLSLIALSSWYPCKSYPVNDTRVGVFAVAHLAAALVSTLLWLAAGEGMVSLLTTVDGYGQALPRFHNALPFLLGAGMIIYLLAASAHYVVLGIQAAKEREKAALELEYLAREAELKAMRAQIDPHFLFNSLNSLSALTTSDPVQARLMCLRLADFLRATLTLGARPLIRFEEELALIGGYLDIEKIRFGERLSFESDVAPGAKDVTVPSLILQPLIENAVKHGVTHLIEGGTISLVARVHADQLLLRVENPCDPERPAAQGERFGLDLVRRRLVTQYGADASLAVHDQGGAFRAELVIPGRERAA
jgi:two-component system, LytTR family, sensor histidine kinase AlgZ